MSLKMCQNVPLNIYCTENVKKKTFVINTQRIAKLLVTRLNFALRAT